MAVGERRADDQSVRFHNKGLESDRTDDAQQRRELMVGAMFTLDCGGLVLVKGRSREVVPLGVIVY